MQKDAHIVVTVTACHKLLQHTATHCNTLHHTATHYNALWRTMQHVATRCNTLQQKASGIAVVAHCNDLQHTLQHIATNCNRTLVVSLPSLITNSITHLHTATRTATHTATHAATHTAAHTAIGRSWCCFPPLSTNCNKQYTQLHSATQMTHCNTHCNKTATHTATGRSWYQYPSLRINCNTQLHTATQNDTLQLILQQDAGGITTLARRHFHFDWNRHAHFFGAEHNFLLQH